MKLFAQVLSGIFVLILGIAGITTMLFPEVIAGPSGFNPVDNYGLTNVRTLGAPTLALAVAAVIGIIRKEWILILPASMYFFFNGLARVISTGVEGYEPVMLTGLIVTFCLFALSQVAIYLFRKAG